MVESAGTVDIVAILHAVAFSFLSVDDVIVLLQDAGGPWKSKEVR